VCVVPRTRIDFCGRRRESVTDDNIDSHMFSAFSVAFDDALDIAEPGRGKSKPTIVCSMRGGSGVVVVRILLYRDSAEMLYRDGRLIDDRI